MLAIILPVIVFFVFITLGILTVRAENEYEIVAESARARIAESATKL